MKLNPIRDNIAGKRLVVVDDSIVRGTTMRALVAMLREAGAAEVHLRISSPPYRWPCFFGMDTGTRAELLAADLTVPEVRDYLGCDTLAYLELDRLLAATGAPGPGSAPPASPASTRSRCPARRRVRPRTPTPTDEALASPTCGHHEWVRPTPPPASTSTPARQAVERIKARVRSTFRPEVLGDVGGFGGLFAFDPGRYRDPVLVVLHRQRRHQGPGRPPGAAASTPSGSTWWPWSVDDIAAQGAEPLFFLDYVAVGRLDPDDMRAAGRRAWSRAAGRPAAPCIGGRDGRAPGVHGAGRFDLAGLRGRASSTATAWSPASGSSPATASSACRRPGCAATATPSPAGSCSTRPACRSTSPAWPGAHHTLAEELLRPSVIYAPALVALCRTVDVRALAHITGGGLPGQPAPGAAPRLRRRARRDSWPVPRDLRARSSALGDVADDEMARVFNLGIGMVAVVSPDDVFAAHDVLRGGRAWIPSTSARSSPAKAPSGSSEDRQLLQHQGLGGVPDLVGRRS